MGTTDRELVARLTADLAADPATVVPFVEAFGDQLAAVVRRHLTDFGRRDLIRDPDEMYGLVWEVALELQARASGWQPGPALPWTWADRALRSCIARAIGHARADVELDQLGDTAIRVPEPGRQVELGDLAGTDGRVALLLEALGELRCSERDRAIFVEYRTQLAHGDRSPAETVAPHFGVTPVNARQIHRRVGLKLAALVDADPRYAGLRGIPWLTGGGAADPSIRPRPPGTDAGEIADDDDDGAMGDGPQEQAA